MAALYVDKGLKHVEVLCRVCLFPRLEVRFTYVLNFFRILLAAGLPRLLLRDANSLHIGTSTWLLFVARAMYDKEYLR